MQLNEIKLLRRLMESYCLADLSADKLREMALIISMLQMRLTTLTKTSNQFDAALNSTKIKIIKSLFAGMAGLLFFGGGFFAGQSVAVFMAALFVTSIPTFWPIVVFSTLVGLAAFAVYWYIEKPVLQKLISSWFGLDEEKIEQICDTSKMEKEGSKLGYLNSNIAGTLKLKLETVALTEQLENVGEGQKVQIRPVQSDQAPTLVSNNRYSFHRAKIEVNQNNDQDYGLDLLFSA